MADDTQQRAAGRTRTRATAKDSASMGRTLILGELEVVPSFNPFNGKIILKNNCDNNCVNFRYHSSLVAFFYLMIFLFVVVS